MKKLKKLCLILIALMLSAFCLTSCGDTDSDNSKRSFHMFSIESSTSISSSLNYQIYESTHMVVNGTNYNNYMKMYIVLYTDSTYVQTLVSEYDYTEYTGTYTLTSTELVLTDTEQVVNSFEIINNKLYFYPEGENPNLNYIILKFSPDCEPPSSSSQSSRISTSSKSSSSISSLISTSANSFVDIPHSTISSSLNYQIYESTHYVADGTDYSNDIKFYILLYNDYTYNLMAVSEYGYEEITGTYTLTSTELVLTDTEQVVNSFEIINNKLYFYPEGENPNLNYIIFEFSPDCELPSSSSQSSIVYPAYKSTSSGIRTSANSSVSIPNISVSASSGVDYAVYVCVSYIIDGQEMISDIGIGNYYLVFYSDNSLTANMVDDNLHNSFYCSWSLSSYDNTITVTDSSDPTEQFVLTVDGEHLIFTEAVVQITFELVSN